MFKKIPTEAQPIKMYLWGNIQKIAKVCGSKKGIEIDPDKVRAIQYLPLP